MARFIYDKELESLIIVMKKQTFQIKKYLI